MVVANEINQEKSQKERNEKEDDRLFGGQRVCNRNDQAGQVDNLSLDLDTGQHNLVQSLMLNFRFKEKPLSQTGVPVSSFHHLVPASTRFFFVDLTPRSAVRTDLSDPFYLLWREMTELSEGHIS